jgi:pimeloyl-ACP methyl ester carboxylesterase
VKEAGDDMECMVKGIPIHYEEYGAGLPLLLLSGSGLDHRYMTYHLEPLFGERPGWRRLYPDLPGTGQTPGADWISGQDDMLEVALGFLDAVVPHQRFAVAGASYGGYLARGIVAQRGAQMTGLLLCVPAIAPERANRHLPPHQVLVHDPAFVAALDADEQDILDIAVVQSAAYLAAFRATVKWGLAAADHVFLDRVARNPSFSFAVDHLPEPFPAPTLIVTGRQDALTGYQDAWEVLENYPRATFAVLDRAGHDIPLEQSVVFRTLASEWLDRVEEHARHE